MELFEPVLEAVSDGLCLFSILVLVWGVIRCAVGFFRAQLGNRRLHDEVLMDSITTSKNGLGVYILLSLEILIAADIIDSILNPNVEDLVKLGAIVAIRTVISYFLNKEIHETEELLAHHAVRSESAAKLHR